MTKSNLWAAIAYKTESWKFGSNEFTDWLSISIYQGHPRRSKSRMIHLIQQRPFSSISEALATRDFALDGVHEPQWALENYGYPIVDSYRQFVIPVNRVDGEQRRMTIEEIGGDS